MLEPDDPVEGVAGALLEPEVPVEGPMLEPDVPVEGAAGAELEDPDEPEAGASVTAAGEGAGVLAGDGLAV